MAIMGKGVRGDRRAWHGRRCRPLCGALALVVGTAVPAALQAIGSAFTYQGSLVHQGQPAGGAYDFEFVLQDAGGAALGALSFADVVVVDGVFTLALDFGAAAFDGDERFLRIAVREGAQTGAYTVLNPATAISAAPYAQHATEAVFAHAVTANSIGSSNLVDGSVGAADVNAAQVQTRVAGECPAGQYIRQIQASGAVACESVSASAGTVNRVATGAGLTGGPIFVDGTIAIATNGVTGAMIAPAAIDASHLVPFAIGAAQVDAAQVQLRVQGLCTGGDYVSGIALDGSLVCAPLPFVQIRNLDSTNDVGEAASVALRDNGRPLISYFDRSAGALKLYDCASASCGTGTARTLVGNGVRGEPTALLLRGDGRPLIAYQANGGTSVYDCADAACGSGSARVVDAGIGNGFGIDAALGQDGFPLISYVQFTAGEIRLFDCADAGCATGAVRNIDPNVSVSMSTGQRTGIAVKDDGSVWIAWQDAAAGDVRLAFCSDPSCTSATLSPALDAANNTGGWIDLELTANGTPVLSYYDATSTALKFMQCNGTTSCATPLIHTLDNAGANNMGSFSRLAVRSDGRPLLLYHDVAGGHLRFFNCADATCSGGNAQTLVIGSPAAPVGQHIALVLRDDDRPITVHHDEGNDDLEFHLCSDPACT